MSIKYENPKDNENREALFTKYLEYLTTSNDLIENKDSYDAFFYIGKTCSLKPTTKELQILLEKNLAHIFIKTLKALFEKISTLDFNNKTIEADEPKIEKDFKESIFVYILYSINILNMREQVNIFVKHFELERINLNKKEIQTFFKAK